MKLSGQHWTKKGFQQIANLRAIYKSNNSNRIKELTEHLRANKKDKSTQHGLLMMVSRRNKLLKYLNRKDHAAFLAITEKLSIRRH